MCVCACACLRVSRAATCTCMLDSTYEGGAVPSCVCVTVCVTVCVCACVCVCVFVAVAMTVVIYLTSMGRAKLLVMHVMSCTCTVGTSSDTYIMGKLPYTL